MYKCSIGDSEVLLELHAFKIDVGHTQIIVISYIIQTTVATRIPVYKYHVFLLPRSFS